MARTGILRLVALVSATVWLPLMASAQSVQIKDVGFQGYFSPSDPLRVRVHVANPSHAPLSFDLRFQALTGESSEQTDSVLYQVKLLAGQEREFDIPLPLARYGNFTLQMEASAGGRSVGKEARSLTLQNNLVAILCPNPDVCHQAQDSIVLSGTQEEQAGKSKSYIFLTSGSLFDEWWAYSGIHAIVLARPVSDLSAAQQTALEGYVREGGQLVLIDSLLAKAPFLERYRRASLGKPYSELGVGRLYHVADLGVGLATLFNRSVSEWSGDQSLQDFRSYPRYYRGYDAVLNQIRPRLATTFVFPRLQTLLCWLGVYILIVGICNFAILRYLDRREWGWVTTPVIALFFSAGLYFISTANRPKQLHLDEVAVYTMDEASPMAVMQAGVRVSSPRRDQVSVVLPEGPLWNDASNALSADSMERGLPIHHNFSLHQGWEVQIAPEQRYSLPLLQWSFKDLEFKDIKMFPGTVRRLDDDHLINETGRSFQDAIYWTNAKLYLLGAVSAGASIDLRSVAQEPFPGMKTYDWKFMQQQKSKPFTLRELIWNASSAPETETFYGLADEPILGAQLADRQFERRHLSVTVVSMVDNP